MIAVAIVAVVIFALGAWVIQGWVRKWVTNDTPEEDDVRPLVASPNGYVEGPSTNDLRRARAEHFTDAELERLGLRSVESRARRRAEGELLPPFERTDEDEDDLYPEGL